MEDGRTIGIRMRAGTAGFASAVRIAPEILVLQSLFIGGSILARRVGALPGGGAHLAADVATVVLCTCLYVFAGISYCGASAPGGRSHRAILRRLGIGLVLAVASTFVFMLFLDPAVWDKYFYLRWGAPAGFAALWSLALLPQENLESFRLLRESPGAQPLRPLVFLLGTAAFLVTLSDLALQFTVFPGSAIQGLVIQKQSWVTNILVLFGAYALVYSVTSRTAFALLLVTVPFVVLCISTILKLRYMHSPVSPIDLLKLREFKPFFLSFFGTAGLAAVLGGSAAWIAALVALFRSPPRRTPSWFRRSLGALALMLLLAIPAWIVFLPDSMERWVGTPEFWRSGITEHTRTSGFLLTFLSEIPSSVVAAPPGYSAGSVAAALRRTAEPSVPSAAGTGGRRVNLIVYLVESLMDPAELGWRYTSDPIPNLRALRGNGIEGRVIVPDEFGGSADTEFSVLTGMTQHDYMMHTVPYRQSVNGPLPSLPHALKQSGYRTIAVQADPRGFYNRERIYPLLDFDESHWLQEDSGVERAKRRYWPSDNAIVDAVLRASRGKRPFFAFAFPSSTHFPYNSGAYKDSDLKVLDPMPEETAAEVTEYINALRDADRAIGRLVRQFRGRPEPTMIVILGDHLPPLSDGAYSEYNKNRSEPSPAEQAWRNRSVPFLLWANFDLPGERIRMSSNALLPFLLEKLGIRPRGFHAAAAALRQKFPIFTDDYVLRADGTERRRDLLPPEERRLVDDFLMLQYDLLFGEQYSLRGSRIP